MPYKDGSPTLGEQVEAHMENREYAKELRDTWDEGHADGFAKGIEAAEIECAARAARAAAANDKKRLGGINECRKAIRALKEKPDVDSVTGCADDQQWEGVDADDLRSVLSKKWEKPDG